jgi:hypothetical protein
MAERILVINPNSSAAVTAGIDAAMAPLRLPGGPEIECATLAEGPPGIETQAHVESVAADSDVRALTGKIADLFMGVPDPKNPKDPPKPNLCLFAWGAFQFAGMFESFNETLDFFSPGGRPLRATVAVSMVEDRFDYSKTKSAGKATPPPSFSPSGEDVPVAKAGCCRWRTRSSGG